MKSHLIALAFVLAGAPAIAQDCNGVGAIIAIRDDGVPVYTHQEPEIYWKIVEQLRPTIGERPADRPILAADQRVGLYGWVNRAQLAPFLQVTKASLQETLVYKGPDHCRPKGIPWEISDPAVPGQTPIELPDGQPIPEPIELFPEEPSGPLSGLWRAEIGPTAMDGCPPMMQNAFPASGGALPGLTGETRRMDFADPFHPDTLEMSRTTGVRWQQIGDQRWRTTDMAAEVFGQIPQGDGGGSRLVWTLTVLSPEEMAFDRAIEIVLPAVAAGALGLSPEGCRVTGTDRWIRVGD